MSRDHLSWVDREREKFIAGHGVAPEKVVARKRYEAAERIVGLAVRRDGAPRQTPTDRIDRIVLHRLWGPVILLAVIFAFYELSIVQGYKITAYTWPLIAAGRDFLASLLPGEGFIFDPIARSIPLGVLDGIAAVLNYIPIFMILFALIAFMEDSGYMARVAFLLDRIFRAYGLHGQSAMPMILSGVFVGGCAIPGVMACRTIKDEKARLATMLILPLMNCLAKIPLYVLLVGMFFPAEKGIMMFFISTITLIVGLGVAKILSLTVLKREETAPFVLELPVYHLPTVQGILRRCLERTWLFVRKIVSVVTVVALIIYLLLNFPALGGERRAHYEARINQAVGTFFDAAGTENRYAKLLKGDGMIAWAGFHDDYRKAKMGAGTADKKKAVDAAFMQRDPDFFRIAGGGKTIENGKTVRDKEALAVSREYRKLDRQRKEIRAEIKEETITGSILGRAGIMLEPLTHFAGFNWRVNIALISSFAAKENSVATLGSIYQVSSGEEEKSLEERMKEKEKGWTPLHALALIVFMTMYPPCVSTLMMIRIESGKSSWTLFATLYPIVLGSISSVLVFSGGSLLGLSGFQAMIAFYLGALLITAALGFVGNNRAFDGDDSASHVTNRKEVPFRKRLFCRHVDG